MNAMVAVVFHRPSRPVRGAAERNGQHKSEKGPRSRCQSILNARQILMRLRAATQP